MCEFSRHLLKPESMPGYKNDFTEDKNLLKINRSQLTIILLHRSTITI